MYISAELFTEVEKKCAANFFQGKIANSDISSECVRYK